VFGVFGSCMSVCEIARGELIDERPGSGSRSVDRVTE
jgi:hypothetical protein